MSIQATIKTFNVGDTVRDLHADDGDEHAFGVVTDVSDWPHHIVVRWPDPVGEMEWYRGCAKRNADAEGADFDDLEVVEGAQCT